MSPNARGDGPVLASLDFLGDDQELRARARAELRADGESGSAERRPGAAASRAIRVITSARGLVEDVEVSRDWRKRLDPDRFADALFQAYAAALAQTVNAAALREFAASEQGGALRHADTRRTSAASPEPPGDSRVWLASVWDTLRELDDTLHRLDRGRPDGEGVRHVASPHGHLTATCRGRQVIAVGGDTRRIREADPQQLRTEALAVFRAARLGDPA
ncbi:hypothetical protein [Catellatospora citrea]|uniref:Uncharacterized protein n=1 Tax=Catellatospora citrea TaxID=53366 RepID=A0A8J3NZC3_9ACTN|nr:hypothetical protein [Catellatospora citrea]RKE00468.1 hypothetical protein C8E86_8341 [Catellatospora citrea]GIF98128.1 hypothetical protein Cci01nite_32220 [Catellatospora citrea]